MLRCLYWNLRVLSLTHLGSMPSPHHLLMLTLPLVPSQQSGNEVLIHEALGETVCVLTTTSESQGLSLVIEGLPNH